MNDDILWAADQLEIRNLLARLTHLADDGELDAYVSLFTDDGSWEPPPGSELPIRGLRGHAELLAGARERRAAGMSGPGTHTRHVVTNVALERVDQDCVVGHSYWHYYTSTDEPIHRTGGMGTYDDEFRRTPDGWRLARRVSRMG